MKNLKLFAIVFLATIVTIALYQVTRDLVLRQECRNYYVAELRWSVHYAQVQFERREILDKIDSEPKNSTKLADLNADYEDLIKVIATTKDQFQKAVDRRVHVCKMVYELNAEKEFKLFGEK